MILRLNHGIQMRSLKSAILNIADKNRTLILIVFALPDEIENNFIHLLYKFLIATYHARPIQENRNYECLDNLNSAKYPPA